MPVDLRPQQRRRSRPTSVDVGILLASALETDHALELSEAVERIKMMGTGFGMAEGVSRLRTLTIAGTASAVALGTVLLSTAPATAHHGWPGFETDHLVYIAGTVSSEGVWGNPHSQFEVTLDSSLPADTPELRIPEQLQDPEDSSRVDAAIAYGGPHKELKVIIAPPAWSGRWGLGRALEVGERFQAVGYVNRTDDGLFRPVVFWYGDDAAPVNQVLGNTLPVRAPLP